MGLKGQVCKKGYTVGIVGVVYLITIPLLTMGKSCDIVEIF